VLKPAIGTKFFSQLNLSNNYGNITTWYRISYALPNFWCQLCSL